ncbi:MAG TPA: hypothetical protein VNM90_01235, partial [Haliangium sp.]|nr:hypothetical protein [Haliangium sp.]
SSLCCAQAPAARVKEIREAESRLLVFMVMVLDEMKGWRWFRRVGVAFSVRICVSRRRASRLWLASRARRVPGPQPRDLARLRVLPASEP